MNKKKLFIVDSFAHIFRSYYAIRNLTNNAVYGFAKTLIKLVKDYEPDYIVAVFDVSKKTFRHEMYERYKANRKAMPDDLKEQIPIIKQLTDALNIKRIEKEGLEADDIIAAIAKKGKEQGYDCYIVSSDKDLFQLVDDNISILDTKKDYKILGKNEILDFFGVEPSKVADVLSLMGDSSDNIPGAKGIGEKTAKQLISEFGTLENLYNSLDKIKGKKREKLENSKANVFLSKKLVTLKPENADEFNIEDYAFKKPDSEKIVSILRELNFYSLLKEFDKEEKQDERDYKLIDNEQDFYNFLTLLKKQKSFSFDFETCSLDTISPQVAGISFSFKEHSGYYIALISKYKEVLNHTLVFSMLKPFFEEEKIKKTGHNLKYEYSVLKSLGITLNGIENDSMLLSYLLNSSYRHHSVDELALKHLNIKTQSFKQLTNGESICGLNAEDVLNYACEDSDIALRLANSFRKKVKKEKMEQLYNNIEKPLIPILAEIERNGVLIDKEFLARLSEKFSNKLEKLEKEIFKEANTEFNIRSPKQLGEVLFLKMKLPVLKKTKKTKSYSTSHETLEELAKRFDIAKLIVKHRMYSKLKSTYVDSLPALINEKTNRIHTSYNQTVTATGRLSSSDPNLQNIPIKTEEGRLIRQAFIADKGSVLVSADYSQIELRILAHLSEDETLINAFKEGQDIHKRTASEIFKVEEESVTEEMRAKAKAVNFGVIYGKSEFSLSKELGISIKEAKEFIDYYFERMPKVKEFIEKTLESARKTKKVYTMFNRVRTIQELASSNKNIRKHGERMAVNMPIQGSAADIIKIAMINMSKRLKKEKTDAKIIMQVHDELVFEVNENSVDSLKTIIKEEMENYFMLKVPLAVNIAVGKNWSEAK
jgi:DNA polymerase-1